jgi:hypothetical protein
MIGDLVDISRHHTDAVTALLATAGVVAYTVEVDVDTDDLTYPYTVVYPNPGTAAGRSPPSAATATRCRRYSTRRGPCASVPARWWPVVRSASSATCR